MLIQYRNYPKSLLFIIIETSNPLLSHLQYLMSLWIAVLIIILLWISMLVHHNLRQVQKLLPECYCRCPARWYCVLFWHFSCSFVNVIEVSLDELTFSLVMNPNVCLIVNFPAPSVVVHRPQCHAFPIKKVHFRMQHSLSCLINWHIVANQPLEKHVIENALKHWLVPASCR